MYGSSVFRLARISNVRNFNNGSTKKLLEFLADMPKVNTARITEAQQQRQNISKKGEKYGPSTVYLQVLGSGARGVPNTLYLFTDQKRYLFNCGECTQRLAHEHKVKLSRLEHVFITSKTWKNIGGLPGLSLTLQDVGVPKITLHGPEGLDDLYNATKRFVIMKEMQVTMAPSLPAEEFEDGVMSVKYVHLLPPMTELNDMQPKPSKRAKLEKVPKQYEQFTHDNTDYYTRPEPEVKEEDKMDKRRSAKSPDQGNGKKAASDYITQKTYVAYICTLKKRLGALDLAKCVEKGVPPGPLLGQLKSGIDVVLPDGTIVLSKDVKNPDDPGPVFIVLEMPDIGYLCEADFLAHFDNGTNPPESIPALIVHMSPPEVFHHPDYKAFMTKFGPTTNHLIVNSQNSCLGSEAVHRTQHKLHLLDPEVFPLLRDTSIPAEWTASPLTARISSPSKLKGFEDLKNRIAMAQFQNICNMDCPLRHEPKEDEGPKLETHWSRTLTMFHLRPKKQIDRSAEPKLHVQEYYQETMDVEGFVPSLDKFRQEIHNARYAKNESSVEYPKIVFLGTGSCIPSKTRNTSAIIVHVNDQSTILLDCGEGTYGQLARFYGPRKVDELLRTLKAVYISHLHADHHIGLIGVLQARAAAFANVSEKNVPLFLLAPGQIVTWLTMYDKQFERIAAEYTLIPNQNLMANTKELGLTPAALQSIGLEDVRTCLVPHCPNAFGVAITAAGYKITYSGDTLPAESLVKIGENSTILIHEATMEDELANEARIKMHSTTSQAIEIGRQMNAKYTLLTHFSQRYARLPRLNANILNDNHTVGIAFDNMQITLSDLPLLPYMYAPLQLMFAEHCVDMEVKAASRERRKDMAANLPGTRHFSTSNTETNVKEAGPHLRHRLAKKWPRGAALLVWGASCKCTRGRNASSEARKQSKSTLAELPRAAIYSRGGASETELEKKPTARLRSRCCSGASSTTRSITHDSDREQSKGERSKDGGSSTKRILSVAGTKNDSFKRNEVVKKKLPTRYKENLTARLRRQSLSHNSVEEAISQRTSSNASRRTSNFTAPNSKCVSPRTPSPDLPWSRSLAVSFSSTGKPTPINNTPAPSSTGTSKLSVRAQDLLSDVTSSNHPSCALIERKPTKNVSYETKTEKMPVKHKQNSSSRASVSRTYVKVKGKEKEGYGLPLLKTTNKLVIRPYNSSSRSAASKPTTVSQKPSSVSQKPSSINSNCSSAKPFKPESTNIESSFHILKKESERNIKSNESSLCENVPRICDVKARTRQSINNARSRFLHQRQPAAEKVFLPQKPQPLREDLRNMMLRQAKQKFQSKQYLCQSKFERIEGLNWISWTK